MKSILLNGIPKDVYLEILKAQYELSVQKGRKVNLKETIFNIVKNRKNK